MKKIIIAIILSLLILSLSGCAGNMSEPSGTGKAHVRQVSSNFRTAYIVSDTLLYDRPGGRLIRKDIFRGRVVTALQTGGFYTKIVIYTYDTPIDNIGWVPSDAISFSSEGIKLIEGRTRYESFPTDGPPTKGKKLSDTVLKDCPLIIEQRKDGWVYCQFPGGLTGWIPDNNIEFAGPQSGIEAEFPAEPGSQAKEEIRKALNEIVPKEYGDDERYLTWEVKQIIPLEEHNVYFSMAKKLGGTEIVDKSYLVELHFPKLAPSASMSAGQLFLVKTSEGWSVWYRYH